MGLRSRHAVGVIERLLGDLHAGARAQLVLLGVAHLPGRRVQESEQHRHHIGLVSRGTLQHFGNRLADRLGPPVVVGLRRADLGDDAGRRDRQPAARRRQGAAVGRTQSKRDVFVQADRRLHVQRALSSVKASALKLGSSALMRSSKRRMRGHQAGQSQAFAEQHVADFLDIGIGQLRPVGQAGQFFQRAGDAPALPGELHRRCIGQVLALRD